MMILKVTSNVIPEYRALTQDFDIQKSMLCPQEDPNYEKLMGVYAQFSRALRNHLLKTSTIK